MLLPTGIGSSCIWGIHLNFAQFVALLAMINLSRQGFSMLLLVHMVLLEAVAFGGSFKVCSVCRFVDGDKFS
jgi:hypothetical protein